MDAEIGRNEAEQDAIVIDGICKRFGDVNALDDVTLSIEKGKVYALLGPNGAGKTTLIKILTTLLQPDEGTATVGGFDVVRQPQQVREIMGWRASTPPSTRTSPAARTSRWSGASTISGASARASWRRRSSSASSSPTRPTGAARPTRAACAGASTSARAS